MVEELALHQRLTEAVIMASLDVDSVVAEIEYERAQIHLMLTSRIAEHSRLPIDVLTDRVLMLVDLESRVSLMKRDLRALLRAVSQVLAGNSSDIRLSCGICHVGSLATPRTLVQRTATHPDY